MMQENSHHLARAEAILFIDGEMSSAEMTRAELHVHQCPDCRCMLSEMNDGIDSLKAVLLKTEKAVYGPEQANRLLKMKLTEARSGPSRYISTASGFSIKKAQVLQFAALAIAIVLVAGLSQRFAGNLLRNRNVAMLPDKGLTPGAVRQVALEELCAPQDDDDLDPAVPSPIRNKVFYEYGVSADRQGKDFQVDYLVNPQLGGTDDIHNLWPQPYHSAEWNAAAKDHLERHLHQMVCSGEVNLAEAQRDISTNWIAAYQKYFHKSKPV